jgi:hypothetical protein
MEKNLDPTYGINIFEHIYKFLGAYLQFFGLKYSKPFANSVLRIWDTGWKNPDMGSRVEKSGSGIQDKHPGLQHWKIAILFLGYVYSLKSTTTWPSCTVFK